MYMLSEIAPMMNALLKGESSLSRNWHLLIDSRTVIHAENAIFFALRSKRNDGHQYIEELISKGVTTFVVDRDHVIEINEKVNYLIVDDTLEALQKLAGNHRKKFILPVIGITGSNGKTIIKEWLTILLANDYNICASPKSYNSQIGVPLSVWQLNDSHSLGIFEAGISKPGEMQVLEKIIQPEIGVLTHLGTAHDEGFEDFNQKVNEKLKLFSNCKIVLMRYDSSVLAILKQPVLTFGFNDRGADLDILECNSNNNSTILKGVFKGREMVVSIPFSDEVSIENACLCWLTELYLDRFDAEGFNKLSAISMRLELKQAVNNCLLINDSYSNDLNALSAAFSFLKRQSIHQKTTVILSDIEQSGLPENELCRQVNQMLLDNHVDRFYAIGNVFHRHQEIFSKKFNSGFYISTEDFLKQFNSNTFANETILLKGARSFRFEAIAGKLEKQTHGTVLEINLTAAQNNLNYIKSKLPEKTKIMAMVKAFAYGSGSYEIAKMLEKKVDYLAVAYADEGVTLRQNGLGTPILVMNTDEDTFDQIIEYKLEPAVFSIEQLKLIIQHIQNKPMDIHLEFDTGMHRLGFSKNDMDELIDILLENRNLNVRSVFSHLSASDESVYDPFTMNQFLLFRQISSAIEKALGYQVSKHISNTAATLRFQQEGFDMVRLGIGLYGIDPSGENQKMLENVFTLKTTISQVKMIAPNESIGYARKGIESRERKIGVLAMGYADGLNRLLSNGNGSFLINGMNAPIIGNICMDMCMVDITNISCATGDEAILFGKNKSIIDLATQLNTIPYEVLTAISQRVKRVYVSE